MLAYKIDRDKEAREGPIYQRRTKGRVTGGLFCLTEGQTFFFLFLSMSTVILYLKSLWFVRSVLHSFGFSLVCQSDSTITVH